MSEVDFNDEPETESAPEPTPETNESETAPPESPVADPVAPVAESVTPSAPITMMKMKPPEILDYSDGESDEVIGTDGHCYKLRPSEDGQCRVPFQAVESAENIGWTISDE